MVKRCVAVRHVAFEDLGILGPLVSARGYEIRYHDAGIEPFAGDSLIAADLVVVLGGPIGVYEQETYPFIADEIAAVAARLQSNKPMLGICLGADDGGGARRTCRPRACERNRLRAIDADPSRPSVGSEIPCCDAGAALARR
jgi:hypothetical protein